MKDELFQMEFNEFYERELKPNLLELEKDRKALTKKVFKGTAKSALAVPGIVFGLALFGAIVEGAVFSPDFWIMLPLGMLILYSFGFILMLSLGTTIWKNQSVEEERSAYVSGFTQWILNPLVKFLDPSFSYSPYSGLRESEFKATGLYGDYEHDAHFDSEDEILGEINDTWIQCSECKLYREIKTEKSTRTEYSFKGMLVIAEPKDGREQKEHTIVVPTKKWYKMSYGIRFTLQWVLFFISIPFVCLLFGYIQDLIDLFNSLQFLPNLYVGDELIVVMCVFLYMFLFLLIFFWLESDPAPNPKTHRILALPGINGKPFSNVPTSHSRFKKRFQVFSDDSNATKKTLSLDVMKHLIEINDKLNNDSRFAFCGDKIYMAIWHDQNIAPPRIWQTILNKKYIRGYLREYESSLKVINATHLS